MQKDNFKVRISSTGVHFFNRDNGLNILFDEFIPNREKWSKSPRQVSIALTNACDLSCTHCYAPKSRARLNSEDIIRWMTELDDLGTLGIGFGGGEPTVYSELAKICAHGAMNTKLAISLTTHGHNLNDCLISELKGKIHFLRISMDGLQTSYEKIRKRSFDAFMQNLRRARSLAPFGINFVVNSTTIDDLEKAVLLAQENGASEFLLLPEQKAGRADGIDEVTLQRLRKWSLDYTGKIRLSVSELGSEGLPICSHMKNEEALDGYAFIDAQGILKQTSYSSQGISIGSNSLANSLDLLKDLLRGDS